METGSLSDRLKAKSDPRHTQEGLLAASLPWVWRVAAHLRIPKLLGGDTWYVEQRLISEVLEARCSSQVFGAVDRFHYRGLAQIPWSRRILGLRVSGRRLIRIACQILPSNLEVAFAPTTWGGPFSCVPDVLDRNPGHKKVAAVAQDPLFHRSSDPADPIQRS